MRDNHGMDLWSAPVVDVRPLLGRERQDLLAFVGSLTDDEWFSPTRVPGWTVKDLALHVLDDDLGWLSRGRDRDRSGRLDLDDAAFVDALNRKNQAWVEAAGQLSRRVVLGLLEWAGQQMGTYYASQSLTGPGHVPWAGDDPVPNWFDLAQDLTERWVHQMQMREAVDKVASYRDDYLADVMSTFVWAFPHQYRAAADPGSKVLLDLGAGGERTLTSDGARWHLGPPGPGETHVVEVRADADHGWRWLTGGDPVDAGLHTSGPRDLVEPLLQVRAVLV
jgi:uncharacterized protein (TIGR03083 family)